MIQLYIKNIQYHTKWNYYKYFSTFLKNKIDVKLLKEKLSFGNTFTDHMLEIDWDNKVGWKEPIIRPYGDINISPASSALHYGLQCFEGMKAYIDDNDRIRLFRPELNMKRMNHSMKRLFLPEFNSDGLIECLKKLLIIDKNWIPKGDGYSLYIRPTGISTHAYIGVGASASAKIYIILSPVGPYYPEGFNPVKLYADDKYVRAWPGGTGNTKIGGNYGPTILPQMEAAQRGYSQVLWLFGDEHYMTEVGTMNLFVFWINEDGEKELITAPIERGDILPGVTRQSIIELCLSNKKDYNFKLTERTMSMKELEKAYQEKRILEIFGSGTAAVISPVSTINYKGKIMDIPLNGPEKKAGPLTQLLWKQLMDIQYGKLKHEWSVIIDK